MPFQLPEKVGEPTVLAKKYGKALISQLFTDPKKEGRTVEFCLFHWPVVPSIVMPVTPDNSVVAVRQFRYGANKVVIEFPGGNPKPGQTPEDVAFAEMEDETGYVSRAVIRLGPPIFFEPAFNVAPYHPFLAVDCIPTGKQNLEREENLEVVVMPLKTWVDMVVKGEVCDSKTIAMTLLALPYLGIELKFS